MAMLVTILVTIGLESIAVSEGKTPELEARRWFNNPIFRLDDQRNVLIFFFTLADERDAEETIRWTAKLNAYASRRDWVIIGLTQDPPFAVESFLNRHHVRFTIGAGSSSYKDFKIDKFPKLVVIDRKTKQPPSASNPPSIGYGVSEVTWDEVGATLGKIEEPVPPLGEMDEVDLMNYVESDAFGADRAAAVGYLFEKLNHEEFLSYMNARVPVETDPWVRGKFNHLAQVAAGTRPLNGEPPFSTRAMNEFTADPSNTRWAAAKSYRLLAEADRADFTQVHGAYASHPKDTPEDALVRRMATEDLWHRCTSDGPAVRKALMRIASADPDAAIRRIACMALGKVCATGDLEVADLIDSLAEQEPDLVQTKPMMEYVAHYIRTGQEDTRAMAPKP